MNDTSKSIYEYWAARIDSYAHDTFTVSSLRRYTPNTIARSKAFMQEMLVTLFEKNKLEPTSCLVDCWPGDVSIFLAFTVPTGDLTLEIGSYALIAWVSRGARSEEHTSEL